MDDLRIKIIEKYQIDIDEDNLLELYKIKDQNISSDDLKKSIEEGSIGKYLYRNC